MASTTERDSHQKFFRLLCKAAGVDHLKVRSIIALVGTTEPAHFDIETIGDSDHIETVLQEQKAPV